MAKKMFYIDAPEDDAQDDDAAPGRTSYRERSEQADAIAGLALLLVGMKPAQLAAMPLPPELAHAVVQCQGFTKNARARQLRLIAKLLRQVDHEELRTAVTQAVRHKGARSQRDKTYETCRERLLTGGDTAFGEFLTQHRDADAQRLRQLVRLAGRDPTSARGKHATRELFRMIRDLGEARAAATSSEAHDETRTEAPDDEAFSEASDDEAPSEATDDAATDDAATDDEAPDDASDPTEANPTAR